MDHLKRTAGFYLILPGLILQTGGPALSLFDWFPEPKHTIALVIGLIGTGFVISGLGLIAYRKGHHPLWAIVGFLGIVGIPIVIWLPDRFEQSSFKLAPNAAKSDAPTIESISYYCLDCNYPLEGIQSNKCPECGRWFDLDDEITIKVGSDKEHPSAWQTRWSLGFGIIGIIASPFTCACGPTIGIIGLCLAFTAQESIRKQRLDGDLLASIAVLVNCVSILSGFCSPILRNYTRPLLEYIFGI